MAGAKHTLYNAFGQTIDAPYTQDEAKISYDLGAYSSGVYFINIQKNGFTWTNKIVVE